MNVAELPMILFTTIAQMCVGAFVVLGVIQTFGSLRFKSKTIDRLADPALFAIGPAMVAGLGLSMLHMHDVSNTLNVLRHWNSSWLSREIIFGTGFAGLGFLFFLMQWKKIGSARLRQVVASVTAVVGVAFIFVMSRIYSSLVTVPAWNSWAIPLQFFATAVLLGSLLVGTAFVVVDSWRKSRAPAAAAATTVDAEPAAGGGVGLATATRVEATVEAPVDVDEEAQLLGWAIRGIVVTAMLAAAVILVAMPVYISGLAAQGGVALQSAEVYSGAFAVVRFALLALGAGLMGLFAYFLSGTKQSNPATLTTVVAVAFLVCFIGELMGRSLFYEAMIRGGI